MIRPHLIQKTPRYTEMRKLRTYLESTQYAGRPDFWKGENAKGHTVPLRERAPCVIYPLPKIAVRRVSQFTFGETRYPHIRVDVTADDQALFNVSVSEEDAKTLEQGIVDMEKDACLRGAMLRLMEQGLACRTAIAILSIKDGHFRITTPNAEDCWPTFAEDDPSNDVVSLVWCYQFDKLVDDPVRGPINKRHWFRRDYDATGITFYAEIPVEENKEPEWKIEEQEPHGFTFCPVLWIRNEESGSSSIDGRSIYDDHLDEFDALNFALSQRHRGITFFGTPQPYETGVEDDDGPEADGRTSTPGFSAPGSAPMGKMSGKKARRMSPDFIWSYRGPQVQLGLLETTGRAFEVATMHVNDIRARLCESMSIVLAGADDAISKGTGDMSARLLSMLYAPMLSLVDALRDAVWWPYGLKACISMMLRMLSEVGGRGVHIPKAETLAEILQKFKVQTEAGERWMCPSMTPIWGENFSPSNGEIVEAVTAASQAKTGGLIQPMTATKFVAPHFGVDNADEEAEQAMTKAAEQAKAMTEATFVPKEGNEPPAKEE